jgi:hypothetical protein
VASVALRKLEDGELDAINRLGSGEYLAQHTATFADDRSGEFDAPGLKLPN